MAIAERHYEQVIADLIDDSKKPNKAGAGLVVLLVAPDHEQFIAEVRGEVTSMMDLRSYGIGAQILSDMGVHDLILLTNTDVTRIIVAIEGYGLNVVGQHVLVAEGSAVAPLSAR